MRPPLIALILLCVPCWTACAPVPVIVRHDVPPALLTCQAAPAVPSSTTGREVAYYIADLSAAGADCRDKLGRVAGLIAAEK